jgi:glycosyltransferase involved in cell wall biosynthesis
MATFENFPPVISAVMCTYGRFKCVERALNCFIYQQYPTKELIIYNTDEEHPYNIRDLKKYNIQVVNNNIDYETGLPYTNVGAIRRDAIRHATGEYVITWDDDDIYLPHFMAQAILRMEQTGLPSFKPEMSFFYSGNNLRLVRNTLEASIVAKKSKVIEYGYLLETGKEGLGWYTKMRDNKELNEHDKHYIPAYCFNWNDGDIMDAPHKQSGDIDNPENFENHKKRSLDRVNGRCLQEWDVEKMQECYKPYFEFLSKTKGDYPEELVKKFNFWE